MLNYKFNAEFLYKNNHATFL